MKRSSWLWALKCDLEESEKDDTKQVRGKDRWCAKLAERLDIKQVMPSCATLLS